MNERQKLALVATIALSFGAGLLFERHQDALKLIGPKEVLYRSTTQLVKAAEELQLTKISTGMSPSHLDDALLALHDVAKLENSTAVYNFRINAVPTLIEQN